MNSPSLDIPPCLAATADESTASSRPRHSSPSTAETIRIKQLLKELATTTTKMNELVTELLSYEVEHTTYMAYSTAEFHPSQFGAKLSTPESQPAQPHGDSSESQTLDPHEATSQNKSSDHQQKIRHTTAIPAVATIPYTQIATEIQETVRNLDCISALHLALAGCLTRSAEDKLLSTPHPKIAIENELRVTQAEAKSLASTWQNKYSTPEIVTLPEELRFTDVSNSPADDEPSETNAEENQEGQPANETHTSAKTLTAEEKKQQLDYLTQEHSRQNRQQQANDAQLRELNREGALSLTSISALHAKMAKLKPNSLVTAPDVIQETINWITKQHNEHKYKCELTGEDPKAQQPTVTTDQILGFAGARIRELNRIAEPSVRTNARKNRYLTIKKPDENGMIQIIGLLTPEVGAAFQACIAMHSHRGSNLPEPQDPRDDRRNLGQRRADAIGKMTNEAYAHHASTTTKTSRSNQIQPVLTTSHAQEFTTATADNNHTSLRHGQKQSINSKVHTTNTPSSDGTGSFSYTQVAEKSQPQGSQNAHNRAPEQSQPQAIINVAIASDELQTINNAANLIKKGVSLFNKKEDSPQSQTLMEATAELAELLHLIDSTHSLKFGSIEENHHQSELSTPIETPPIQQELRHVYERASHPIDTHPPGSIHKKEKELIDNAAMRLRSMPTHTINAPHEDEETHVSGGDNETLPHEDVFDEVRSTNYQASPNFFNTHEGHAALRCAINLILTHTIETDTGTSLTIAELEALGISDHYRVIELNTLTGKTESITTKRRSGGPLFRAIKAVEHGVGAMPGDTTPANLCELHHIQPWSYGGETSLPNLLLTSVTHHVANDDSGTNPNKGHFAHDPVTYLTGWIESRVKNPGQKVKINYQPEAMNSPGRKIRAKKLHQRKKMTAQKHGEMKSQKSG